jgi:hypothetical protein
MKKMCSSGGLMDLCVLSHLTLCFVPVVCVLSHLILCIVSLALCFVTLLGKTIRTKDIRKINVFRKSLSNPAAYGSQGGARERRFIVPSKRNPQEGEA